MFIKLIVSLNGFLAFLLGQPLNFENNCAFMLLYVDIMHIAMLGAFQSLNYQLMIKPGFIT